MGSRSALQSQSEGLQVVDWVTAGWDNAFCMGHSPNRFLYKLNGVLRMQGQDWSMMTSTPSMWSDLKKENVVQGVEDTCIHGDTAPIT